MLISGAVIALIYIAGTAALLVALAGESDQRHQRHTRRPWRRSASAAACRCSESSPRVLLALTSAGGLGAWVTGTARLPFVMGLGHYLPERLGAVHPKYGSPHVALLVQAGAVSLVLLLPYRARPSTRPFSC